METVTMTKAIMLATLLWALAVPAPAAAQAIPDPDEMWRLHLASDAKIIVLRNGDWLVINNAAQHRRAVALWQLKRAGR
jgi:hypothetical protein